MRSLRLAVALIVIVLVVLVQWRLIQNRERLTDPEAVSRFTTQATPQATGPLADRTIGLVVGHWNAERSDPGAVCQDDNGNATLTELTITVEVADRLIPLLEEQGARVWRLGEQDSSLVNLTADLVLSIHADSCVPNSGFKAASHPQSGARAREKDLIACMRTEYAASTGLQWDEHTITVDMTRYHVHEKVTLTTPSVILEMGFLGGDQMLLTQRQERVTAGILNSILCHMDPDFVSQVPAS